jgi:FR47-like protein
MLVEWALQPGSVLFRHGQGVAVAAASLSQRDRIAVAGPPNDAVIAVREALAELGPAYRPFGEHKLIEALIAQVPELELADSFGWMQTTQPIDRTGADWLSRADEPEIGRLLAEVWPGSYARPGVPGVTRWAGARDHDGHLAAVAADAWSSSQVGFLAGVASSARARGQGHAATACALVINDLLRDHTAVALMVDGWNKPAINLYSRLGMTYLHIAAACARRTRLPRNTS